MYSKKENIYPAYFSKQNSSFEYIKFPTFDTSNYELDRPLSNEKNKKLIGLMKDELDYQIARFLDCKQILIIIYKMTVDKKAKCTKKCILKKPLDLKGIKTF